MIDHGFGGTLSFVLGILVKLPHLSAVLNQRLALSERYAEQIAHCSYRANALTFCQKVVK